MDTTAITNFLKNASKNLVAGVAGAVTSSDEVRVVPAIAPIPIDDVNTSYGAPEAIERPKKEEGKEQRKYEEIVEERIKEVAFKKSMPYQPEVALQKGGIVKRETIAKVGEKEPEVVTPVKNYGESVEQVYRQGAALIISSSLGFLKTLPPSPAKGSVIAETNRLKGIFGLVETPKPQKVIGLKAPLVWWGSGKAAAKSGAMPTQKAAEGGGKKGGGGFNLLRTFRNLKNLGKKFKVGKLFKKTKIGKTLRNTAAGVKKLGRPLGKLGKSTGKLLKSGSKAGKTILKKGIKKIGAKVGGKALAKVGAKALGKGLLKKIPFVGMGAGLLFAGQRLLKGDFKGAMLEAASGIASTIPGVGTAVSIGLDATLAAKDMGVLPGQKQAEEQQSGLQAPDPTKDMYGRPIVLNPPTMKAWTRAVNRAAKDGINLPMSVTSSYRSPEQQQALVDAAEAGDKNVINPAQPGNSPHGQGWAIDIDYSSKANEWMRDKGKKFGFQWQGEKDPVHFDFINNDNNDKWLQPGKNKWIPNVDDPVGNPSSGEQKSGGQPQKSDTSSITAPGTMPESVSTLNNEPVVQGTTNVAGNVIPDPKVVPVPQQPQIITVPYSLKGKEREEYIERSVASIDPFGKGVKYTVWEDYSE